MIRRCVYLCDLLRKNLYLLFFLHIINDIRKSGMFVLKLTQLLHCIAQGYMYKVMHSVSLLIIQGNPPIRTPLK